MTFVYMIRNGGNRLYVGVTESPSARLGIHNTLRGARFTKYDPTFQIVFLEEFDSLASARRREVQIKKWRRDKKERLIALFQQGIPTKSDD